ncbi:MAG TPA: hypothetical protein VFZ09_31180 [Archangium sp.]|nr:hypothetical protein [Archangium sp.]HEX5750730.1 hypothetical protein [Archangium sp.]
MSAPRVRPRATSGTAIKDTGWMAEIVRACSSSCAYEENRSGGISGNSTARPETIAFVGGCSGLPSGRAVKRRIRSVRDASTGSAVDTSTRRTVPSSSSRSTRHRSASVGTASRARVESVVP